MCFNLGGASLNLDWIKRTVSRKEYPVHIIYFVCVFVYFLLLHKYHVTASTAGGNKSGEIAAFVLVRNARCKKSFTHEIKNGGPLCQHFSFNLTHWKSQVQREVPAGSPSVGHSGSPIYKHTGEGERWVFSSLWSPTSLRPSIGEAWWLWWAVLG